MADKYLLTYWVTHDPYEAEAKWAEAAKALTRHGSDSTRYAKKERKRGVIQINIYDRSSKS